MKLVEQKSNTGTKLIVTIPKDIVQQLGLTKGDEVVFNVNAKKEIVIRKLK